MHLPTHILAGWCGANLVRLSPRHRLGAMLISVLPDLDGLGILVSRDAYWTFHHKLAHNVLFGLTLSLVLVAFTRSRLRAFLVYVALFHLHLLMDRYGSGPGWGISYLWPFSMREFVSGRAWDFYSWQNITAAYGLLAVTLVIAVRAGRTPLEVLMPRLDRQLVDLFRRIVRYGPRQPRSEALAVEK